MKEEPDGTDEHGRPYVVRWVVTHQAADGLRTLTRAAQGRCTFDDAQSAYNWMQAALANRREEDFPGVAPESFEVRPCRCWPDGHDPLGIYFD